jgi:hypothetical protein
MVAHFADKRHSLETVVRPKTPVLSELQMWALELPHPAFAPPRWPTRIFSWIVFPSSARAAV